MRRPHTDEVWGWGRIAAPGREVRPAAYDRATRDAVLSRGLARSYGDSSLPPRSKPVVVATTRWDRLLDFDLDTGLLRAESGVPLHELNRLFLPRGWFTPVTPGTHFVTLGGMVAADVHGKNHHVAGCFGEHVDSLLLRTASGDIVPCSPRHEPELFWGTVGGMGLTGHILEVGVRLTRVPSRWIVMESEPVADIEAYLAALRDAAARWPFTMGWIDCLSRGRKLGRGVIMRGRWAAADETPAEPPRPPRRLALPFDLPGFLVGPTTVRLFNELYYRIQPRRVRRRLVHPDTFFYPLDAIRDWNRMYGPRGFTQYQCVLPDPTGARRFLEHLTGLGGASMLCVIKDCGPEGHGILSFPRQGISIALDIPNRPGTQELVDALNEKLLDEGGRIYLAKDRFTRRDHWERMEPRLPRFQALRDRWDPERKIRSAQSVRLFGDPG